MDVFGFDIQVFEKPVPHEVVIALLIIVIKGVVFVEVEGYYISKTYTLFFMQSNELDLGKLFFNGLVDILEADARKKLGK